MTGCECRALATRGCIRPLLPAGFSNRREKSLVSSRGSPRTTNLSTNHQTGKGKKRRHGRQRHFQKKCRNACHREPPKQSAENCEVYGMGPTEALVLRMAKGTISSCNCRKGKTTNHKILPALPRPTARLQVANRVFLGFIKAREDGHKPSSRLFPES